MPLIVQASLTIKPEGVDTVHAKLLEASKEYLTHPGCTGWVVMKNVKNPLEFAVVETYADQAAIEYHTKSSYYAEFTKTVGPFVTGKEVKVFETLTASSSPKL